MVERQLNGIVATGVEDVPRDSESCRVSTELDCSFTGSEHLGKKISITQYQPKC